MQSEEKELMSHLIAIISHGTLKLCVLLKDFLKIFLWRFRFHMKQ